jgi:SET domain-containing protein
MESDAGKNASETGGIMSTEWLSFQRSGIHGTGGFASLPIPKGTRIIEYVGEKIDKRESLRRCEANNQYIISLSADWDLDGDFQWNLARLLNHSCAPNCEAEKLGEQIWITAIRDIAAGEELTFNYGFDLEQYREYPCNCGSPNCIGFIVAEEFFPLLRSRQ